MTTAFRSAFVPCCTLLLVGCGASDTNGSGTPNPMFPSTSSGGSAGGSALGGGGSQIVPGGGGSFGAGGSGIGGAIVGAGGASYGGGLGVAGSDGAGGATPEGWNGDCGLNTGWAGDDRCILPPPPDEGFQIHVGPTDYDNPEATYVMNPGDESTTSFPVTTTNTENRFFYYRQYRLRPTAHHMILTVSDGSSSPIPGIDAGRRIATANTSGDSPPGGVIAPENQGVGSAIGPNARVNVSLHAINNTAEPQLREIWVNFWYRDAAEVTEPAIPWFKVGSASFAVQPHQDTTLGPYSCTVDKAGRMLWLYGHRHANNVEFKVDRVRGLQRDVIYDGFHWEEPITLEYSTTIQNSPPDAATKQEGGWNGILDLLPGDRIEWFCHVVNTQSTVLRFTNNTFTGEMCIVDAEAIGSSCSGI